MKPTDTCKAAGLTGLVELTQLAPWPMQTLIRWHDSDGIERKKFDIVLKGAVQMVREAEELQNRRA